MVSTMTRIVFSPTPAPTSHPRRPNKIYIIFFLFFFFFVIRSRTDYLVFRTLVQDPRGLLYLPFVLSRAKRSIVSVFLISSLPYRSIITQSVVVVVVVADCHLFINVYIYIHILLCRTRFSPPFPTLPMLVPNEAAAAVCKSKTSFLLYYYTDD